MHDDSPKRPLTAEVPHAQPAFPLERWAQTSLVDAAAEIQQADALLGAVTESKLKVIVEQVRALQQQARAILDRAQRDGWLHRARCGFRKRPGHVYHLYRADDDDLYLSMLSPQDWKGLPPHDFQGSFRLEHDMSWTPLHELESREAEDGMLRELMARRDP